MDDLGGAQRRDGELLIAIAKDGGRLAIGQTTFKI